MFRKITVVLLSVIIFECHGHLPILGDIISKTRERVHSTVDGVAGAVLGGISHGFNLNLGGNIGFNRHHQKAPPKGQDETIVVIIEEQNGNGDKQNNNNYNPTHHDYQPNHNNFNNNQPQNPAYNGQNQGPYYNNNERENNQNQFNTQNPAYNGPTQGPYYNNNDQENHQNQFNTQNNNYNSNGRPGEWNNGNGNNGYDAGNQINYNKPAQDNQGNNNYNHKSPNDNANQFNGGPITEHFTTSRTTEQIPSTTEKSSDDLPLFVPLDPNQYSYGEENINITAPKRDTGKNKQAESDDEDYGIDVRIKDE